jgi:Flp pilus assembly protein TadG
MFREMLHKCKTYISLEQGFAAIMLALMLPALVAAAGIAVDLSIAYNAKNRLGNALDKAVLAVGSSSGTTQQLNDRFNYFFNANYPAGKYGTPFNVQLTVSGSVMTATAEVAVPTTFMSIVGINNLNVVGSSQVVRTLAGVEAVLVLDTTGSMAGNNIAALKTAATNFINIMFTSISDPKYIKIGIVPWSDNVNVGPYGSGFDLNGNYYGAPFVSPPATDPYEPVSSIKYGSGPLDWGGCVTEPNAASLEQDNSSPNWIMYRYPSTGSCLQYSCFQYNCLQNACSQYQCQTYACNTYACQRFNCNSCCPTGDVLSNGSCCPSGDVLTSGKCGPSGYVLSSNTSYFCPSGDVITSNTSYCCPSGYTYANSNHKCSESGHTTISAPSSVAAVSSASTTAPDGSGACTGADSVCTGYGNTCEQQGSCSQYSNTQCQTYYTTLNRCVSGDLTCSVPGNDANQAGCTSQAQTNYNQCVRYSNGPNDGCTSVPILPLTNNQTALLNEINILPTANNTYSDVGMVWGWRVISPGFPFQEGAAYSDTTWSKTVILMTDGNNTINTVMSGEGIYGATGTSMSVTDQNNKFEQICTNMKALGIRIYTITFQSAINNTTRQFYSSCATNPGMYYDAPTNADLTTAFQNIATQLSQLHLTQ